MGYAGRAMAAYAVIARIGRVDPHLVLRDVEPARDGAPGGGTAVDVAPRFDVEDTVPFETLGDRVARFRERWAQLTFFLFDPDSWRT